MIFILSFFYYVAFQLKFHLLYACGPFVYFWENIYASPLLFFKLGCLSCYWVARVLHVCWRWDSSQIRCFVNIFSDSVGCLFTFDAATFIMIKCSLSVFFSFVACTFSVISEKLLPNSTSKRFSYMFPFVVFALTYIFVVHFKLIFE